MSQLRTDMIHIADKEIVVTLMYSQSSHRILFVEAEKDFVDVLIGFLTLPIGCAIKLLFEKNVPRYVSRNERPRQSISEEQFLGLTDALVTCKTVGAIANVFKSAQRLDAEEAHKKVLSERRSGYGLGCLASESEIGLSREPSGNSQGYYTCGANSHCAFVSPRYGAKCPRHQKKMTTQCTMIDGNDLASVDKCHDYGKNSRRYFVTDSLEIFSSSQSLVLLQKLNVENMSSLYSIDHQVDTDELLQLLRASLTSGDVLNDVFGKSIVDKYEIAAPHQETLAPQHFSKPRNPIHLLRKRGQAVQGSPIRDSMEIAHDWGRGLCRALREIQDAALHSSLVKYVKEREKRINSALRELSFPTPNDTSNSSRASSNGTGTKKSRASDSMPKPCKEILMLEKQVDKVMARLCQLISLGTSPDPLTGVSKSKQPAAVKPPWTLYEPSSRVRFPFRGCLS